MDNRVPGHLDDDVSRPRCPIHPAVGRFHGDGDIRDIRHTSVNLDQASSSILFSFSLPLFLRFFFFVLFTGEHRRRFCHEPLK